MTLVPLSPNERRVLDLYARGFLYKEIAAELGISLNTVKEYARRILVKTAADSLRLAAWRRRQPASKTSCESRRTAA